MSKVVEVIVQAVDKASKTFDDVSKSSKKLESALKSVKKYSWIAMTALAGIGTYAVNQAIKIEPLKRSFDQLAESVWENSKDMLKALKETSKWAISEYDLMASANKAMKLWVADNTDDMTQLMKIARLYWQQMTQDVTSSFNDIVTWLWRWSAQILDNIWIVVDSEKAYEEYAQKIWKTAEELTKQEKTQALVNATIEEWTKALEKFWEPAQTTGERLQALKNSFQEMATRVGEALIPVLEKVLEKITPIIEKFSNWIAENPELASQILLVSTAIAWLTFALTTIIPHIATAITLLSWPAWFVGALWLVFWWLALLENKIVSTDEQLAIYNQEVATLNELYNAWLISTEEYTLKMWELEQKISDTKVKAQTFWQYLKDGLNDVLRNMTHIVKSSKQAFQDFGVIVNAVGDFFERLVEKIANFILKIQSALSALRDFIRESRESWIWSWIVSAGLSVAQSIISWRAVWWPVSANTPYIVGENWPELFVPSNSWTIVPNDQMWWIVVNVNFGGVAINNGSDEMSFAQTITQEITRELELYKKGIY